MVTSRLRTEGFHGRWPWFRRRFGQGTYGLVRFYPTRKPTTTDFRPGFRIETASMRDGDEARLGATLGSHLTRLVPEGLHWRDVFEYPEDIVDEDTADKFARVIVREILEQGPALWGHVQWWEPESRKSTFHNEHWARLDSRPLLELNLLEEAWDAGTARIPPPDILELLRRVARSGRS